MFYIIDGECEVVYRPSATQPADAEAGGASGRPSTAGSQSIEPSPWPPAPAHRPPHPPAQRQPPQAADGDRPPPVASQPSAAGLFSAMPSSTAELGEPAAEAWPAPQAAAASSASAATSAAIATAGMLAEDSGLSSRSSMQAQAAGQGGLCTRRTSTCIAEAAEGAERDLAAAGPQWRDSPQAPQQQQQAQPQATSEHAAQQGSDGVFSALPAQAAGGRREPLAVPPRLAIPLTNEPSTPALPTEPACASSAAGTPIPGSPVRSAATPAAPAGLTAASALVSAAPSPGPFGLRRHMAADMEGASAELLSPAQPPRQSAGAAAPARLHGSSSLSPEPAATQGEPYTDGPARGEELPPLPPPQQQQALPQVEGEELPPSLIQAGLASHARLACAPPRALGSEAVAAWTAHALLAAAGPSALPAAPAARLAWATHPYASGVHTPP